VERGSSVAAEKWTYGLFSSIGLAFNRRTADLTGAMLGQAMQSGITLTATPTAIPLIPISPKDFSVYADTTSAGLGTTKLTRVLNGNFAFGAHKYNPLWVVDQAQTSFVSVVENTPRTRRSRDAVRSRLVTGMGFLANVRAGDTRFVRIQWRRVR
jgi:hypothetical protein